MDNDKHVPREHGYEVMERRRIHQIYVDNALRNVAAAVTCIIEAGEGCETGKARGDTG